jgi:hypothetical protein
VFYFLVDDFISNRACCTFFSFSDGSKRRKERTLLMGGLSENGPKLEIYSMKPTRNLNQASGKCMTTSEIVSKTPVMESIV